MRASFRDGVQVFYGVERALVPLILIALLLSFFSFQIRADEMYVQLSLACACVSLQPRFASPSVTYPPYDLLQNIHADQKRKHIPESDGLYLHAPLLICSRRRTLLGRKKSV